MSLPDHIDTPWPQRRQSRHRAQALALAVLLALGGCSTAADPPAVASPVPAPDALRTPMSPPVIQPLPSPVQTVWRVVQARTEPMLDTRRARLDFQSGGRLVGHTSCNALSASYTLQGDVLRIGPVVTTRMACSRLLMEQEDRLLTALELAATARVRPDGLLELRDAEGRGVLRALRADLPE